MPISGVRLLWAFYRLSRFLLHYLLIDHEKIVVETVCIGISSDMAQGKISSVFSPLLPTLSLSHHRAIIIVVLLHIWRKPGEVLCHIVFLFNVLFLPQSGIPIYVCT